MKIVIYSRSPKAKKFPITVEVPDDATIKQLKSEIHKRFPKYYPERQRLTNGTQPLGDDKTLKESTLKDGDTIFFKDLGPQISWRLVYAIEYLGPLVLHPLFYYFSKQIYGKDFEHSKIQTIAYYLIMAHFIKREAETFFVHRFSHSTMPFKFIFKNSFHYHVLCGLNLAYWLYGPWGAAGTPGSEHSKWFTWTCIAVYMYAEIANFNTHIILRDLRPPGTKIRRIPYGYGFGLVSCPNYFFELIAWISIIVLTKSLAACLFIVVGFSQMYLWAIKKHKNYRKEFKNYPKNRKAIIPYLI
ncbi:hypothetical protein Glove_113g48 [Diversispora epigaea]|uniref:Ubiquitin-like domain-containing protein n=1 Tax=Diversispora epigaea TaxID=1348612 RepID=A0A397J1L5_9GLOM|nr:hypothetical protein Glove_113g48 [Diversispora epigaea]